MKIATVDIDNIQLIDVEINQKSKVKDYAIIYTPSCHCELGSGLIQSNHTEEHRISATSMNFSVDVELDFSHTKLSYGFQII